MTTRMVWALSGMDMLTPFSRELEEQGCSLARYTRHRELPSQEPRTLAQAYESIMADLLVPLLGIEADAIILHLQRKGVGCAVQANPDLVGLGMAGDIGQAFTERPHHRLAACCGKCRQGDKISVTGDPGR